MADWEDLPGELTASSSGSKRGACGSPESPGSEGTDMSRFWKLGPEDAINKIENPGFDILALKTS